MSYWHTRFFYKKLEAAPTTKSFLTFCFFSSKSYKPVSYKKAFIDIIIMTLGAMQKVCHLLEGEGDWKTAILRWPMNDLSLCLGGGVGYEFSIFRSDVLFAWPLNNEVVNRKSHDVMFQWNYYQYQMYDLIHIHFRTNSHSQNSTENKFGNWYLEKVIWIGSGCAEISTREHLYE